MRTCVTPNGICMTLAKRTYMQIFFRDRDRDRGRDRGRDRDRDRDRGGRDRDPRDRDGRDYDWDGRDGDRDSRGLDDRDSQDYRRDSGRDGGRVGGGRGERDWESAIPIHVVGRDHEAAEAVLGHWINDSESDPRTLGTCSRQELVRAPVQHTRTLQMRTTPQANLYIF